MAKFVTSAEFDARAASAYIFDTFVTNFSHEISQTNTEGYDGVVYEDYFAVIGESEGSPAELSVAGELDLSGQPEGTVRYLSVAQSGHNIFYINDGETDLGSLVPLFFAPVTPGTVHPALLLALAGDDDITLSGGTDYFDAGTGFDKVNYDGAREDFTVTVGEGGQLGVQSETVAEDTDTLFNVEKLAFSDGSLVFDSSANADFAYRVYAAAYGRTPDEAGFLFWTDQLDQRGDGPPDADDKAFIASFFLTADEFNDVYGENPTNEEYINGLYQNVLHREADQAGYDFWLGVINEGQGRDDLLIWFTDSDENVANTAPDTDNGFWVG
jgi:hypothetical protein